MRQIQKVKSRTTSRSSYRRAPHPHIVLFLLMLMLGVNMARRAPHPHIHLNVLLITRELCEDGERRLEFNRHANPKAIEFPLSRLLSQSLRSES